MRRMTTQRIRDPLHDLIEFSDSELERTLWRVLQTRPFQRLRRVKQLGFSDLVYPGAAHSRFAHSVGVFHTARQLMEVVRKYVSQEETSREQKALAAALVHDLGHGPFSHAFEKVGKRLKLNLANHETMSDLLIRNGEVAEVFESQFGRGFSDDVADIIKGEGKKTVHYAVVSSQFDADRLDYMRRDRMMAGTQHSAIDFRWLMANLEIGAVATGVDGSQIGTVETFVIGPKAIHAAEGFVLGLFQLYPTVYFHKATRGAEKIFTELLVRIFELVQQNSPENTGLPTNHPLLKFALKPDDVEIALELDDAVVWGALSQMTSAHDKLVSEFSTRLRDRKLYKCYDIRNTVSDALDPTSEHSESSLDNIDRCCAAIEKRLAELIETGKSDIPRILIDGDQRSPYKSVSESKGPLDRINVKTDGGRLVDLKERSKVVAALRVYKLLRVYTEGADSEALSAVKSIVEGEIKACRTKTP